MFSGGCRTTEVCTQAAKSYYSEATQTEHPKDVANKCGYDNFNNICEYGKANTAPTAIATP